MSKSSDLIEPNVRSASYALIECPMLCPHCDAHTAVFALALPAGYECKCDDDDTVPNESGVWDTQPFAAVLSYIDYLPDPVAAYIRTITLHFHPRSGDKGNASRWMNHCEHCGSAIDDEELSEVDGPFGLLPISEAGAVQVHRTREPFEAFAAGQSYEIKQMDS